MIETPAEFSNSYPYAGYLWRDVFVVTLSLEGTDEAESLRTHNDGLIAVAAVHEVYPGHRVQNLAAPGRQDDETFFEGWGLYAEQLMLDHGYYDNGPPEKKFFALRMLLHRAARAFLDPKIHRGDVSPEDAVRFLVERIGVSPERARLEVFGRYVQLPGSASSYVAGKRQIEQLRDQVAAAEGGGFELRKFHDRLLSQGGVSVAMIARKVFGVELDATALKAKR